MKYTNEVNEDMFNELAEQIAKAYEQAILKGIETNSVILNEEFDFCKGFTIFKCCTETEVPPMILGKYVFKSKLPKGYSFALTKTNVNTDELEYYKRRCAELEERLERIKGELL